MLFPRRKQELVGPDEALPGRSETMVVPQAHHTLGTPMQGPFPEATQRAMFGMGCFWGAEKFLWQVPGVHTTFVGYAGGYTPNPTYEEVCTGRTGHNEVAVVIYDPDQTSYEDLLGAFWENHDPTQHLRQGNDVGTQYRSGIYTFSDEQLDAAKRSRDRYQRALTGAGFGDIATEILPADQAGDGRFYYAESYHQQYLSKNPGGYCNHGFCQVGYDRQSATRAALPDEDG
ncbi:MAG TPA: peptide-methionine (S)-S-oxide reductase MsrA [Nitriliruptorales bacterium]